MRIFVYEYITGGGLVNEAIPSSLAYEGDLMLMALLRDLLSLADIEVFITRDARLGLACELIDHSRISVVTVNEDSLEQCFTDLMDRSDAVWPIAPDTEGILEKLCAHVQEAEKILLSTSAATVKLAGNKLHVCQLLRSRAIAVVESGLMAPGEAPGYYPAVLKPVDGVGCENAFLLTKASDFQCLLQEQVTKKTLLLQPFIAGRTLSLSALFKDGRAQLLSCNEMKTTVHRQQFRLCECQVNIQVQQRMQYQDLIERIAAAMPGLWGYAGVDLIVSDQGPVVLEVNPRLTTSYAGLSQALNMNVAEKVLALQYKNPETHLHTGIPVTIKIATDAEENSNE